MNLRLDRQFSNNWRSNANANAKTKDKKMRNLHLYVSTAKPEGSSGGENEEQKRELLSVRCTPAQRWHGNA